MQSMDIYICMIQSLHNLYIHTQWWMNAGQLVTMVEVPNTFQIAQSMGRESHQSANPNVYAHGSDIARICFINSSNMSV